jgi:hypothetical protein
MRPYPNFRDLEKQSGITWHDLVELESRLTKLLWDARHACVNCRRWSEVEQAFAPIRNALTELLGFAGTHHRHPVLGTPGAYQIAYWKLYDAVAGLLPYHAPGAEEAPDKQRAKPFAKAPAPKSTSTATAGN